MKYIYVYLALIIFIVSSCEKPVPKGESGNPLVKFYGDAYGDRGLSIAASASGYVMCGKLTILERATNDAGSSFIESSDEDFAVIGVDNNGNQQWSVNLGDSGFDEARKVISLTDGSFLCVGTGTFIKGTAYHRDFYIAKIGSTGTVIWERHYGGQGNQEAYDVTTAGGGDFVVVGSTNVNNAGSGNAGGRLDMLFMKISASGDSLNTGSYGYDGDEYSQRIIREIAGNEYLVLGTTDNSGVGQAGQNIILVRINETLGMVDNKTYGGLNNEYATDLEKVPGGYIITGIESAGTETTRGLFLRLNEGFLEQTYNIRSFALDGNSVEINSITSLGDDSYLVAGSTGTKQSGDMLFMFVNGAGDENSFPVRMVSGGTGYQTAYDAIIDDDGKIVAVGVNSYETNSLITLLKFDPLGE